MHISKINHVYRLYFSAYQQDLLAKKEEMLLKLKKKTSNKKYPRLMTNTSRIDF